MAKKRDTRLLKSINKLANLLNNLDPVGTKTIFQAFDDELAKSKDIEKQILKLKAMETTDRYPS